MNRTDFEESLAYLRGQADISVRNYREFRDEYDNGCYQGFYNGAAEVEKLLRLYDAN